MADVSPQKNQVQMTTVLLTCTLVPSANMAVEELLSNTAVLQWGCSNIWGALMSAIFASSQKW